MDILISFVIGAAGYLVVTFWMSPLLRYIQMRHEVIVDLVFYANTYHEESSGEILKLRAVERRESDRRHAAEFAACYYRLPWFYKAWLRICDENPVGASKELIALSNANATTYEGHLSALKNYLRLNNLDV